MSLLLSCKIMAAQLGFQPEQLKPADVKDSFRCETTRHTTPHHCATPRYATLRHATPRYATPRHATPRHATLRHATPRYATPRHATPRHATPRHTTPHHTTLIERRHRTQPQSATSHPSWFPRPDDTPGSQKSLVPEALRPAQPQALGSDEAPDTPKVPPKPVNPFQKEPEIATEPGIDQV